MLNVGLQWCSVRRPQITGTAAELEDSLAEPEEAGATGAGFNVVTRPLGALEGPPGTIGTPVGTDSQSEIYRTNDDEGERLTEVGGGRRW